MIKVLFFDVGYTLVDEGAVWEQRCRTQAEMEEAKSLGLTAEDIYREVEKASVTGLPQFRTVRDTGEIHWHEDHLGEAGVRSVAGSLGKGECA